MPFPALSVTVAEMLLLLRLLLRKWEEKKPSYFLLVGEEKAEQNSSSKGRESNPTKNIVWDLNCLSCLSSNWADISNSCSSGRCESLQELHEPGAGAPGLFWSSRNGRELNGEYLESVQRK